MFFTYHTSPARMQRLFAAFSRQAVRVNRARWLQFTVAMLLVPVCIAATVCVFSMPQRTGMTHQAYANYGVLLFVGLLFLAGGLIVRNMLVGLRHPLGPMRGATIAAALLATLPAYSLIALVPSSSIATCSAADVWLPWALVGCAVLVVSRFILWARLAAAQVEPVELQHLTSTIEPILRDLPPDALCSLTCNPFPARWTATLDVVKKLGRTLGIFNDVLLDFRVEVPDQGRFVLRTLHRRVDKYKDRKQKFKGSKHVVAQSFRVERPGVGPLVGESLSRFDALAHRAAEAVPNCLVEHGHEPSADGLRLWLRYKRKFSHTGPLRPTDLPAPAHTLATIGDLSRFAAGLGR